MKSRTRSIVAAAAVGATVAAGALFAPAATAVPAQETSAAPRLDNRAGPLTKRQDDRRKAAQRLILSGQAAPNEDGVVQLADDKYFQVAVTGTGRHFTTLSEFGDQSSGKLGSVPGPLHNEIPQPDRSVNNSTHWRSDFTTAYYEDLFFGAGESFADVYSELSSGNYTVAGEVTDWVKVHQPARRRLRCRSRRHRDGDESDHGRRHDDRREQPSRLSNISSRIGCSGDAGPRGIRRLR